MKPFVGSAVSSDLIYTGPSEVIMLMRVRIADIYSKHKAHFFL